MNLPTTSLISDDTLSPSDNTWALTSRGEDSGKSTISDDECAVTAPSVEPTPNFPMTSVLNERRKRLASATLSVDKKVMRAHRLLMNEQRCYYEAKLQGTNSPELDTVENDIERQERKAEQDRKQYTAHINLIVKKNEEIKGLQKTVENQNKAIEYLKQKLEREKALRTKQVAELEQLQTSEFNELEKEHTQFVTNLVNSYQREVDHLREQLAEASNPSETVAASARSTPSSNDASDDAAEAAVALSALASTPSRCDARAVDNNVVAAAQPVPKRPAEFGSNSVPEAKKRKISSSPAVSTGTE